MTPLPYDAAAEARRLNLIGDRWLRDRVAAALREAHEAGRRAGAEEAAKRLEEPERLKRLRGSSTWEFMTSIDMQGRVIAAILETEAEEIRKLGAPRSPATGDTK